MDSAEVVLRAGAVTALAGSFHAIGDATAADGIALGTTDASLPKLTSALAAPAGYVELTFQAETDTAYRLWMRGKAQNNSWANDSVFVQFSNSVDADGAPITRIGTTSATVINLEEDTNAGVSGWGWQDNGWGANVLGPLIYFAKVGPQTIRVQTREDGFRFESDRPLIAQVRGYCAGRSEGGRHHSQVRQTSRKAGCRKAAASYPHPTSPVPPRQPSWHEISTSRVRPTRAHADYPDSCRFGCFLLSFRSCSRRTVRVWQELAGIPSNYRRDAHPARAGFPCRHVA